MGLEAGDLRTMEANIACTPPDQIQACESAVPMGFWWQSEAFFVDGSGSLACSYDLSATTYGDVLLCQRRSLPAHLTYSLRSAIHTMTSSTKSHLADGCNQRVDIQSIEYPDLGGQ